MTFPKTLAADGTYDISSDIARSLGLQITNKGPGNVYYGDIPRPAVILECSAPGGSDVSLRVSTHHAIAGTKGGLGDVEEGMVATGTGITGSVVVTGVKHGRIMVDGTVTCAGDLVTFTPPAISATNGHPILPDNTENIGSGSAPGRGKRIVADASGADLIISKSRA